MLGRQVVVAELLDRLLGTVEQLGQPARRARLGSATHLSDLREPLAGSTGHRTGFRADALQHRADHALVLLDEARQQVERADFGMLQFHGQPLGPLQRLAGFDRQFVHLHGGVLT